MTDKDIASEVSSQSDAEDGIENDDDGEPVIPPVSNILSHIEDIRLFLSAQENVPDDLFSYVQKIEDFAQNVSFSSQKQQLLSITDFFSTQNWK